MVAQICCASALASVAPAAVAAQQPEIIAPGVISLEGRNETFPAIDPVDGSLWFSSYAEDFDRQTILRAPRRGDSWSGGEVVAFSGSWGDRAPRFSPDGRRLYFTSNRPSDTSRAAGRLNIWMVEREAGGSWGPPRLAGVNADAHSMHNSVTTAGTLYVASNRADAYGRSDVYRVQSDGAVEHLPSPINDERSQPDLWVSPDDRWMILVVTDGPGGRGGDDLYASYRRSTGWTVPAALGPGINTSEYEYGPNVSPQRQVPLLHQPCSWVRGSLSRAAGGAEPGARREAQRRGSDPRAGRSRGAGAPGMLAAGLVGRGRRDVLRGRRAGSSHASAVHAGRSTTSNCDRGASRIVMPRVALM